MEYLPRSERYRQVTTRVLELPLHQLKCQHLASQCSFYLLTEGPRQTDIRNLRFLLTISVNVKPGGLRFPTDGANEKQRLSDEKSPRRPTDDHYPRRQSSKVDADTYEPPLPTVPPSRSTVSPNDAQQPSQLLRTTLPHHIPPATHRPSPSSFRGKPLNGPSLRSPPKRNRASNKSLPIREDSDSDVVVFKKEYPRYCHQFPPLFGMNQSDGSPVAGYHPQYPHSPLGEPTNRDNRSHRSSHPISSTAQKSLSHSRTLPKRPPISEQQPIREVDPPQVLKQSNQRLDRQYGFPDNFSERIYQVLYRCF